MSYGLQIYNNDGSSFVFDSSCSVCKILGHFYYHPRNANGYNRKTGIYIPNDYDFYVSFSRQSCYFDGDKRWNGGTYWGITGASDLFYYLDENRQIILTPGDKAWGSGVGDGTIAVRQDCFAIGWPKDKAGKYGVSVQGSDNFSSINDRTEFSFVAYKGEIEIPSSGWLPNQIDNAFSFKSTLVFFYWENENLSIVKYTQTSAWTGETVKESYLVYDKNGKVYSGSLKAKIVIFGNKELQLSKYGMHIYNSNGDAVYDISSGILVSPQFYSFGNSKLYELNVIPNVARPMIIPTTVGGYAKGWQTERAIWDVGLANSGKALSLSPVNKYYRKSFRHNAAFFVTNSPILILDASHYFNFGV